MRKIKISKLAEAVKVCDAHPFIKMNAFTFGILIQQGFDIGGDIPITTDFAPTFVYAKLFDKRTVIDCRLQDLEIRMWGSETLPSITIHVVPQQFVFVKILSSANSHLEGEFTSDWLSRNVGNVFKATIEPTEGWPCNSQKGYKIIDGSTMIMTCEHWMQEVDVDSPLPARRIKL